jgi:DNA polymerase-3 subunit beta
MHFNVDRSVFLSALGSVMRIAPSNPGKSMAILTNIKIEAVGQSVYLTGFDLDTGMKLSVDAEVLVEGSILLSPKVLSDILHRSRAQSMQLEVTTPKGKGRKKTGEQPPSFAVLTLDGGTFNLGYLPIDEFPELPEIAGDSGGSAGARVVINAIPVSALSTGLKTILSAYSRDRNGQILTGVVWDFTETGVIYAATDGHRLAKIEHELGEALNLTATRAIVPGGYLKELDRLIAESSRDSEVHEVLLAVSREQVRATWVDIRGEQCFLTRTLEGHYPEYQRLIPSEFFRSFTASRTDLIAALDRVGILSGLAENTIKLDFQPEKLIVSAEVPDVGIGVECLPGLLTGEPIAASFNCKYLIEGLRTFDHSEVKFGLNAAMQQVVINPLGATGQLYLVMPLRSRW